MGRQAQAEVARNGSRDIEIACAGSVPFERTLFRSWLRHFSCGSLSEITSQLYPDLTILYAFRFQARV